MLLSELREKLENLEKEVGDVPIVRWNIGATEAFTFPWYSELHEVRIILNALVVKYDGENFHPSDETVVPISIEVY